MSAHLLNRALAALPHGPEFRFIDQLVALEPGISGQANYRVRGTEAFLAGHFPGRPMLPGVILIEATAQLAGVVAQTDPNVGPLPDLKLTAVRAAKILGSAQPGETVLLEARIVGRLGNLIQAQTTAWVAGQVVLQADLVLSGSSAPA